MANKKKIQEINAGSMADIAFLLLIFFLMVTTMNTDSGIQRMLPPMTDEKQDKGVDVNERNLMLVFVDRADRIMVKGQVIHLAQLKDIAKEFILNPNDDATLPEKEVVQVEGLGPFPVSKGVISLQNDRGTSYSMYIKVQNELTRAYNEVRDAVATERFGKKFMELTEDQRQSVQKAVPQKISEAEPRNIGGK